MRLIDADKFKREVMKTLKNENPAFPVIVTGKGLITLINNQPTAYDVDKVVEKIEKIMDDESIRFVQQSVNAAVKIVKNGGADD